MTISNGNDLRMGDWRWTTAGNNNQLVLKKDGWGCVARTGAWGEDLLRVYRDSGEPSDNFFVFSKNGPLFKCFGSNNCKQA